MKFVLSRDDFALRKGWKTEETFFSKIVDIQTRVKIFFITKYAIVSMIEIFSLQRLLETRYTTSFRHFVELETFLGILFYKVEVVHEFLI